MKHRLFTILLLSALLMDLCTALAAPVSFQTNPAELYEDAMMDYKTGYYADAAEKFSRIGSYADSADWGDYCLALHLIDQTRIREALDYLEVLALFDFEQSTAWVSYCQGRIAEWGGLRYQAREYYQAAAASRVGDSVERYRKMDARINNKSDEPLETEPPAGNPRLPRVKGVIQCSASSDVPVYAGPSTACEVYAKLPNQTPVEILGAERLPGASEWLLVCCDCEGGKRCGYVYSLRVSPEEYVSELLLNARELYVSRDLTLRYGPGSDYAAWPEVISEGNLVKGLLADGDYLMIECASGKNTLRLWALLSEFPTY